MKEMLFLLLIASSLFAEEYTPPAGTFDYSQGVTMEDVVQQRESEWLESAFSQNSFCAPVKSSFELFIPALVAILVIITSTIVLYMLGSVFDSPVLSALAKQEGYEILLTVIIFVVFFAISGLTQSLVNGVYGGSEGFMGQSVEYSKTMILKVSKDGASLGIFNMLLYMYYTAPIRLGKSTYAGISFNLGAVLRPIIDAVGTSVTLLSVAMGEWLANLSILCFIKRVMMPVFFPIGLLLRSVPQLRGGGNALIAFSFALFIIYPMMLSVNYEIYKMQYGNSSYGLPVQSAVYRFISEFGFAGIAVALLGIKLITGNILGHLMVISAATVLLETLADIVYTVFILSLFLGLLNVFVTLTFAKELSRFMGTEINLSAFIKLI